MRRIYLTIVSILLVVGLSTQAQQPETLIVFAAASLSDAFEEIASTFEAENANTRIIFNFAGSSTLATQLAQGAPADVFASANNTQMNKVQEAGRISGLPHTFVKNRLVLIVPHDNPANITTLQDLANPEVLLIMAAPAVPVREYTETILHLMAEDPLYGEAYRIAVKRNIVSEEDNVRQVTAKVALGEADAGVVYLSDVTPDILDQIAIITIPDHLNTIATYPIAVTNDTAYPEQSQAFIEFVLSDTGQDILTKWNFIPANTTESPSKVILPENCNGFTLKDPMIYPLNWTLASLQCSLNHCTDRCRFAE